MEIMGEKLQKWEDFGFLDKTPEDKKEFMSNVLELVTCYLIREYVVTEAGGFETLIFPIIIRIGNEIEFGINDLFSIIGEVRENVNNLQNIFNKSGFDVEKEFIEFYSTNKIIELRGK